MSKKCSIVGDINIDIITPPFAFPQHIGETSIVLDDFKTSLGGNAANVAAELAALGTDHEFYGAIGDCAISKWIVEKCKSQKMKVNLRTIPNQSAGITFAMSFVGGQRQFVATLGTNKLLILEHLDSKKILKASHLHRAGFWYTPGLHDDTTVSLMKDMINKGSQTSLDIGWDPENFPQDHVELFFKTLEYTQFFFVNEKEILALTKKSELNQGLDVLLGVSTHVDNQVIVVHQGSRGSLIKTKSQEIKINTRNVPQNNPTGTGDIYNAGFIYGLLKDWELEKCGKFADNIASIHLMDRNKHYPTLADF